MQRGSTGMDSESETIRLDGISFSKPFPIDEWNPPKTAALYLVLRKDDGMIIYVGESGNLDDRDFWEDTTSTIVGSGWPVQRKISQSHSIQW